GFLQSPVSSGSLQSSPVRSASCCCTALLQLFDPAIMGRSRGETVMNEVVREFLLETHENLAQLDIDLVTLEKDPTERETLARVFRTLHTVKGTAGFLGLPKLQAVAHAAENLLSRLRAGKLLFNPQIASALLAVVD